MQGRTDKFCSLIVNNLDSVKLRLCPDLSHSTLCKTVASGCAMSSEAPSYKHTLSQFLMKIHRQDDYSSLWMQTLWPMKHSYHIPKSIKGTTLYPNQSQLGQYKYIDIFKPCLENCTWKYIKHTKLRKCTKSSLDLIMRPLYIVLW